MNPPSGSTFPVNQRTNVTITVSYFNDLDESCTFGVMVDRIAPKLVCPDIYTSQSSVEFKASVTDNFS